MEQVQLLHGNQRDECQNDKADCGTVDNGAFIVIVMS
jgi:hypothetical protein